MDKGSESEDQIAFHWFAIQKLIFKWRLCRKRKGGEENEDSEVKIRRK
jgi:hypothetical protein